MKKKERLKKDARDIFTSRIWLLNPKDLSAGKSRIVKFVKVIRITLDTFLQNKMGFQCVAMSYFCALAFVPIVALIFAVSGGLGITGRLSEMLYTMVPNNPQMIDFVLDKAQSIIDSAQSGGAGLISFLFLLWAVIWMMFQAERVFNNVWGIGKVPRKMYKRFSFYLVALILLPFIVIIFYIGIAMYSSIIRFQGQTIKEFSDIVTALGWLILYIVTVFTLSAMYKFIPAAMVRYKNAFWAAVVAAIFFLAFQYLYLQTQIFVSRLDKVYGVIAAIPLFLMWLNFSWQIIIYGAELSYSLQNVKYYNIQDNNTNGK